MAYDGTGFRGFAPQPQVRTVGGVISKALEKVLRHPVEMSCAGRTDAGVHAWGQVVSVPRDPGVDIWRLQRALNGILGPEIVVRSVEEAPPDFDARHSATWRSYRYTIVNRKAPDPFLARYSWFVPGTLRFESMAAAADPFIGQHDFASFCRAGPTGSTTEREVTRSGWEDLGDGLLRYEIQARAFCWQMVRSIVGTLVDVGRGHRKAGDVMAMLRARNRASAGQMAPPHGLCLWEVGYGGEPEASGT